MGHLIPAGTGFMGHRSIRTLETGEPIGKAVAVVEIEPVAVG
jgi:hypothetical protein